MRISFNPLAERELNDAGQYYDLESPGLGEAFLSKVNVGAMRSPNIQKPGR